jgi:hypothetical protein
LGAGPEPYLPHTGLYPNIRHNDISIKRIASIRTLLSISTPPCPSRQTTEVNSWNGQQCSVRLDPERAAVECRTGCDVAQPHFSHYAVQYSCRHRGYPAQRNLGSTHPFLSSRKRGREVIDCGRTSWPTNLLFNVITAECVLGQLLNHRQSASESSLSFWHIFGNN